MQQSKLLFSVFLLIHKMLSQSCIKLDSLIHKEEIYSGRTSPKCFSDFCELHYDAGFIFLLLTFIYGITLGMF